VPSFLITNAGGLAGTMLGQGIYAFFIGMVSLITPMIMIEFFPAEIRYTASGFAYNMAYGVLGGTAPLVATWFITQTGDPISPAYYIVVLAIIGAVVAIRFFHRFYDASGRYSHHFPKGEQERQMIDDAKLTA